MCFNSVESHFPGISISLGVLKEQRRHDPTTVELITHEEKEFSCFDGAETNAGLAVDLQERYYLHVSDHRHVELYHSEVLFTVWNNLTLLLLTFYSAER